MNVIFLVSLLRIMDLEYISGDLWVQFFGAIFGVIFGVIFG